MIDTSEVEVALCQFVNSIIPENKITSISELKVGTPFIHLLQKLDYYFFSDLQISKKRRGKNDEFSDNTYVLGWTNICECLDDYVLQTKKESEEISKGIDVVLLSDGDIAEIINILFIFITLLVTNKISIWEKALDLMEDEVSKNLLLQIKENLSDDNSSYETPSPRKKGSDSYNSTTNYSFLRGNSIERNNELIERVESLEEKLIAEREISEDLRYKIEQQDTDIKDMEVTIHQKQVEFEHLKAQMETLQQAQYNDMVLYGDKYLKR